MARSSAPPLGSNARTVAAILLSVAGLWLACVQSAQALPSFARQTGQQCASCHNGFPELTPYGRQFKLNGFTYSNSNAPLVPLAVLIIASYTHTQKGAEEPIVPGTSRNDNAVLDAVALFYAGKIAPHVGAYAAGAYSELSHRFALAQADIRYANTARVFGKDATLGVSINNNPALTDPWNTEAGYNVYPYDGSHVVVGPPGVVLQGKYANQVVGGNGYVSWNRWLYTAAGVYGSLDASTLNSMGIYAFGADAIDGAAPYWRLAVEPAWGHSTWEFGTFGMALAVDPHRVTTAGTDKTVDVGVDTEYQYLANRHSWSFMASYITEHSTLAASKTLGFATNSKDNLHTFNVKGTYIYNQTYAANLGYFETGGSNDHALYGGIGDVTGSPTSAGLTGELDYWPFNHGGPRFWRTLGPKFGLQYTYYTRFDGGGPNYDGFGRSAAANNTLFLYTWIAF